MKRTVTTGEIIFLIIFLVLGTYLCTRCAIDHDYMIGDEFKVETEAEDELL